MDHVASYGRCVPETYTLAQAFERQSHGSTVAGSEMYGSLLNGLLADYLAGGFTAEILEGVSATPLHDATPLRYLAVAHRLALEGRAPDLAAVYPSCGGQWAGQDITDAFLSTVATHRGEFVRGVQRGVQTNEVGRAPVLASSFALLASRYRRPLDQLEIGSSAGLLSRWDKYFYDTGETCVGDPDSVLRFGAEWWKGPKPALDVRIDIANKRAVDIAPIDITTEEGRTTMLSFVWPDQLDRIARLRAALDIATRTPFTVEQGDAGDVARRAARERRRPQPHDGRVPLDRVAVPPRETKEGVRAALAHAGSLATVDSPLAWLRMEPATPEYAEVRLTTWPTGEQELLAQVGYHGADIRWVSSA